MATSKRTSLGPKRKAPSRPATATRSADVPTAAELPVTRAMLGEVRTELLERIDARFHEVRADLHRIEGEVHDLKADLHDLKADLHDMKASMARMMLLIEEQNARNKVVLDGLVAVMARQERTERRMDAVEETVRSLASTRS